MKEFGFPLAAPFRSKSFGNEGAHNANDPSVRPQFSLGRHDGIPLRARRTKDSGRRTATASQRAIAQQRCCKRRLAGLSDLVVLAHRTDLSLRQALVFPAGFDVTSLLEATQGRIDSAARETGDGDYVEAVLVALGDCFQDRRGGIR